MPGAVIELGPGTLPWTTYTALRGPLAGERLREDTGYEVGHSLEDGIRAYADWLRAHPELYRVVETPPSPRPTRRRSYFFAAAASSTILAMASSAIS